MPRLIHLEDRVGNNRFEVSVSQRPVVVNTTPLLNKAANTYHRHRHRVALDCSRKSGPPFELGLAP